jgi:hypothetical protein
MKPPILAMAPRITARAGTFPLGSTTGVSGPECLLAGVSVGVLLSGVPFSCTGALARAFLPKRPIVMDAKQLYSSGLKGERGESVVEDRCVVGEGRGVRREGGTVEQERRLNINRALENF